MSNAAWQLFRNGDFEGAGRVASQNLEEHDALNSILIVGMAFTQRGAVERGFEWCCAALSLGQPSIESFLNAAAAFSGRKDYEKALMFLQRGLVLFPDDERLLSRIGICFTGLQEWTRAIEFYTRALEINPEQPELWVAKGFAHRLAWQYSDALQCYRHAATISSGDDYEEAINNHGCTLIEMGHPAAGLDKMERDCRVPDRPYTVFNKSLALLGLGDWPRAWKMNTLRHQIIPELAPPPGTPPRAEILEDLKDNRVLFLHEQGLGDCIQFMRYARLLRPHARELTVAVPSTLARMANLLDAKDVSVVVYGQDKDTTAAIANRCDMTVPFLDAPALLEQRTDNIPGEPYLLPVPQHVVDHHAIGFRPGMLRVGLCWAGGDRPAQPLCRSINRRRSIPFELLSPLFGRLGCSADFVSLQLPEHHQDDDQLIQPLQQHSDALDTMAIIAQLDLVITVDSMVAHLAAAMQKPTWLLSRYDGCWRWFFDERSTSPWYPSMRIWRQRVPGDWQEVIQRVTKEAENHAETQH